MMSERRSKRSFSPENARKFNPMPPTSAHASTRITIEQKVSSAKKGPVSFECSVDPKDLINRRFGEGSKPLFSRDGIHINQNRKSSTTPTRRGRRKSSSSDSSEEHSKPTINTRREKSYSPKGRKKSPEKIPYFVDAKREEDRLKAKYVRYRGSRKTRSRSPPRRRSRTRSRSPRRNRHRSRRRSRPRYRSRSRSRSRRRHRSYDRCRRSRSRSRSRSCSYSRSRSCSRDRYRSSSRDRSRHSLYTEQRFIPVAIPLEYPYSAGWMPPPMPGYHQNPYMLRPPIPFYPLRPPFAPMGFPMRPPRFPGRPPRPYRPGLPKHT